MIKGRHRLPSGFGTIRKLGGNRSKPYAVHPPAVAVEVPDSCNDWENDPDAYADCKASEESTQKKSRYIWKRPSALCYVSSWETGLKVLVLYHVGMYREGIEDLIEENGQAVIPSSEDVLIQYCQRVLDDIEKIKNGQKTTFQTEPEKADESHNKKKKQSTFEEVYSSFREYKYGPHAQKQLSKSTKNATSAAYKRFAPLYKLTLDEIGLDDLQGLVDMAADEGLSKSTVSRMVTLAHQLYRYAYPRELCIKESGKYVEMPRTREEEHHQDFNDEELSILWSHYYIFKDPVVAMILIMCYSGFRVNEYCAENFIVDLEDGYFKGGIKTSASRDRIVPIHSSIMTLVKDMKGSFFSGKSTFQFREDMKEKMVEIGIDGRELDGVIRYHTPHSCRHTFSRLCESYGVNEADRKRMLGHSLRNDVTNGVYGHRTIKELREQIEKIIVPGEPQN